MLAAFVIALDVIYLYVIKAIVEVSHVQRQAVFIDFLIDLYLVLYILNAARWHLTLRYLPRHGRSHARPVRSVCLAQTRVVTLHLLRFIDAAATARIGTNHISSLSIFKILHFLYFVLKSKFKL